MILYHAVWDLVYIFGYNWKWYQTDMAFLWQQSICFTFILLSGFCFSLGKRKVRRGLVVFGAGVLISLVTELFMPQNRIRFGVLTLLGSCMLIVAMVEKVACALCKPNENDDNHADKAYRTNAMLWGIVVSLFLFIFSRRVNYGVLGFADVTVARLPWRLYNLGDVGNFLGFTEQTFFSTDYFSLIPWIFLFFAGICLHGVMADGRHAHGRASVHVKSGRSGRDGGLHPASGSVPAEKTAFSHPLMHLKAPVLNWMGRHSLLIYMLHQPVLYLLISVLF
jgi:uncharacterized membrane protein